MITSSRRRFAEYQAEVAARQQSGQRPTSYHSDRPEEETNTSRQRSFWVLLSSFWRELGDHRGKVLWALATLTVSTLLGLIPPAGTKLAIDYVLTDPPLPLPSSFVSRFGSLTPMQLLWVIATIVVLVTLLRTAIHIWGRWHATKAVQMMQADLRRRVFEHAMRLPLHRIQI
jgi:ATP-binding cassette, subfamily B, bacterial